MTSDPRTVDRDGFVIGTDRAPGAFGSRPSVGGIGAVVQRGNQFGVIVGLETAPDGGLLLHLVWLPDSNGSQRARNRVMREYMHSRVEAEQVAAEGLIACDAWLPDA